MENESKKGMKPRSPKSFAAAITKVRTALTDEGCAEIVGRSASLIRKWADPDHPSLPSVEQAIALDLAFAKGGHGDPPILELYGDLLADVLSNRQKRTVDILLSALSVQGIVGDLSEAIREATRPESPGGIVITPRERTAILEILERLDDEAEAIEDTIEERDP